MPHLLGELLPGFEVEVPPQASEQSHDELPPLGRSAEMGEAVQHGAHQTGLHHKLILTGGARGNGEEGAHGGELQ